MVYIEWLDRWGERLAPRSFSSPYAIVLAKIFRRKGRLLLVQLVLITAGTMFLLVATLAKSIDLSVTNELNRWKYDVCINFEDQQNADRLMRLAQTVPGVERSEVWLTQPASILSIRREKQPLRIAEVNISLTSIPTDTLTGISTDTLPDIIRHKLAPKDGGMSRNEQVLVVSTDIADTNDLQVDDVVTLKLNDQTSRKVEWTVIGVYETVFINDAPAFAPLNAVYDVTNKHNRGNRLLVRLDRHDATYLATISNQLQTLFKDRNINLQLQGTGTAYETRHLALSQYTISINMLLMLAVIVAIVGGIGLMGALSISVVERTRDIGVLRAIGVRSQLIISMFVLEGILQGLISWAVAASLSFLIGYPVVSLLARRMLDINLLDYSYSYGPILVWLAIILVIATLASITPARSAARISVQESLAYV